MSQPTLTAKVRKPGHTGGGVARRLRKGGEIPGNLIYEGKSVPLTFPEKSFAILQKSGLRRSTMLKLQLEREGKVEENMVIVKELDRHSVTGRLLHTDFYRISQNKPLKVSVAIQHTGEAKGIKTGGALEQFIHSLKISTLPKFLKEVIEIDITHLNVEEAIYLSDLDIPKEWNVLLTGNPIVLKIARARLAESEDVSEKTEDKQEEEGSSSAPKA